MDGRRLWRTPGSSDNISVAVGGAATSEGAVSVLLLMMELLEQTIRGVLQFGQEAMAGGNVWILMFVALVGIGVFTAMRGKLTESWLWIPILALAMWYAVYRWLQLRT